MLEILHLFKTKENYNKYISLVDTKVFTKETKQLVEDIGEFYSSLNVPEIIWEEFETWFCIIKHSSYKEERLDLFKQIFARLKQYSPTETYEEIIQTLISREYATKIADTALSIADGTNNDLSTVQQLMDEYETKHVSVATKIELEDMPSFSDLQTQINSSGTGLNWRLDCLNQSLGPLRLGDFIIVGKRPEVGGTTFSCSEASYMAKQLPDDRPVLYVGNEESELALRNRIKQAAIGKDSLYIGAYPQAAEQEYVAAVGSLRKIQLKHKAGVSVKEILDWCEAYNPGLIIIDQLWKVQGFHNLGEVQRLTALFQEARRWAQLYAPVIAVHQADGASDGEKYLHYNRLYGSKTGVQGEADAIIMLGATEEVGQEHTRYINIPKNKLIGDQHTDEAVRHGKFEVRIRADIARFTNK